MIDRFHYHTCPNSGTPYVLDTTTFQKYYEGEPGDLLELCEVANQALYKQSIEITDLQQEILQLADRIDELEDEVAHFRHELAFHA